MKNFLLLLVLLAAVYVVYRYTARRSFFEVNDRLVVSQVSGVEIYSGNTPPPKFASISGVITNTAQTDYANVLIIYTIGYDTVSAEVGFLLAGDSADFRTNSCRVRTSVPEYTLEEIKFEDVTSLSH